MAKQHRWSGFPGAYCLDCGAESRKEICNADGHEWPECGCGSGCKRCSFTGVDPNLCQRPECQETDCPAVKEYP